ncbi:2-isopropylmalate synthase [Pelomyxa schiedti]|nr:2-isopropylmalate synthase [Pelomyxa schiedti]
MKALSVTLERHNITFHESFCTRCPLDKIVKMEIQKRFGVEENQQVTFAVVSDTQEEVSLSDTSSTLSQLFSLLPQSTALSSSGKEEEEEASNTAVAQVKVRMKPVMAIVESDLSHVSTLGSGCYGTVYKYIHMPSSKEVAVKTLFEVIASPHNVERFRLEAEIVSGLRHPNIVKCLGTCTTTTSGKLLIVSELMCCSLRQLLRHVRSDSMKQRLDFKQLVSISLGVANGMDSLHRQNIMHRDLSSNNVLFDSNGVPKICDFGVSRGMSLQTPNRSPQTIVPGTMVHMAPQMFTNNYAIEGDLWGFGMLMAEMINGDIVDSTLDKLPLSSQANFFGEQMRTLSPPDVAEVRRLCPEAGESAIAQCLSRRNAGLAAVNYFTHSPESPLLTSPHASQFSVCVCLSVCRGTGLLAIHDITRTHHDGPSSSCACTTTTTGVTDDQVTDCITQWLSSLSPFVHHLAAAQKSKTNATLPNMWGWFGGSATTTTKPLPTSTNEVVGYNGETKDGVPHGRGFERCDGGDTYEGEWKDGAAHGRGFMRWDGGDTYEGEWHNGERDGWGVFHWAEGGWFEGLYRGDRRKRGALHSINGVDVFDGDWVWNDTARVQQMQGWGVLRRVVSNMGIPNHGEGGGATRTVYEGQWYRDKWHGCGTWHSPETGDIYHGEFDQGKRSGYGRMLFGDVKLCGGSYVGGWKDGVFHGRGVRIWDDGTRYEGDWVSGKENGAGTKTWACDGTSIAGVWEMGVIKSGTKRWPNGDEFTGQFTMNGCCGEGMATFRCGGPSSTNAITLVGNFKENDFQETKCGGGRGLSCSIGHGDIQLEVYF